MERDFSKISLINDWSYLIALETGLFTRGELSGVVLKALNDQARLLCRRYLVQKSKLDVRRLTPAESEILDILSETAANLRRRGRLPHNIVKSLRAGGLIAAVERSVCASGVLQCHNGFYEDGLEPGAFERIVARHPQEFGDHARQNAALFLAEHTSPMPPTRLDPPLQASA